MLSELYKLRLKELAGIILNESENDYNPAGEKMNVNKYVFHIGNFNLRDKIDKEGLIPTVGDSYFCFSNREDAKECKSCIFATNSENKKDWFDSTHDDDVWRIDTSKINNTWFQDSHYNHKGIENNKHVLTFEKIPRSAMELIYKGTGKNNL